MDHPIQKCMEILHFKTNQVVTGKTGPHENMSQLLNIKR